MKFDTEPPVMVLPDTPDRDDDGDEAPETPLDEPRPPRVQDPPPQPDTKGPYVVSTRTSDSEGEW
jgi:hypothetical protein